MPNLSENKGNLLHIILNSVLAVFYVPYGIVCFLCLMATEGAIDETNALIIASYNVIAYTGLFTALTAHICLVIAFVLYSKGHTAKSYLIRFLPIINMVCAVIIATILEAVAKL